MFKKIIEWGDYQDKALFSSLKDTGQRVSRFLKEFTWEQFDKEINEEYPHFNFTPKQKGKKRIITFITPETKEFIIEYRKQFNKIMELRNKRTTRGKKKTTEQIFPMKYGYYYRLDKFPKDVPYFYVHDHGTNHKKPLQNYHLF